MVWPIVTIRSARTLSFWFFLVNGKDERRSIVFEQVGLELRSPRSRLDGLLRLRLLLRLLLRVIRGVSSLLRFVLTLRL